MNYIINNIIGALHDDDNFCTIIEADSKKGFVRIKELNSGKEFKITVKEIKKSN